MRITNKQIYDELLDFRGETRKQLRELNGRVRKNAEAVTVALDRTERIGEEVDHHADEEGAHGGASARIAASGETKMALIGLAAGVVGGAINRLPDILNFLAR